MNFMSKGIKDFVIFFTKRPHRIMQEVMSTLAVSISSTPLKLFIRLNRQNLLPSGTWTAKEVSVYSDIR